MKYSDKLRDPRWQKKRLEIFNRDKFKCTNCGSGHKELHVHHEIYSGEPWDAPNEYLKTLCHVCHLKETTKNKLPSVDEMERQRDMLLDRIKGEGTPSAKNTWMQAVNIIEREIANIYG